MKVYIANFGEQNYEWSVCKEKSTVATMNDVDAQPLWEQGKKEEYISSRIKNDKSAAGKVPTRAVASRWFNLMTTVSTTSGDIWIHKDGEKLFWTISKDEAPHFVEKKEPVGRKREVVVCHKPCHQWSDRTEKGDQLLWRALHPKAKDFLSTEATLQKLGDDNAEYAIALIKGNDLSPWHGRELWRKKNGLAANEYSPVTSASNVQKIACRISIEQRMAHTALKTTQQANGQLQERSVKNKEFRFRNELELEQHIVDLIDLQDGVCVLTGLPLEMDEVHGDSELFCSLDRIDSDGHYEAGNLQVVCRFANRWKGSSDDDNFRRIIALIKEFE
ncbi:MULTISPECIES: hypothetical protein [unclassified Idiomarina]|jgi:hypothetical protein|uniref:hypothetical protein n=1 Tax=unclassified Idiomarina TaxID=2614829 RepID=UPI000C8CA1EA|nr:MULTISPECIES: hypothetical protein [unclassified Idiomarina]MAD53155.1 hypothetical protein [Idiomarinaceae bacterium]|tara:strand:- start:3958 stop:4953 length:996 start_codon:yes stop_codon:yes gene_type:complete